MHLPVSARVQLGQTNLWIQGSAGRFSQDTIADPSGFSGQGLDGSAYGTSVGLDYALTDTLKLGVTTGYGCNQHKLKVNGERGSANSYHLGLYGLWEPTPNWYTNSTIGYGHHRFKGERRMTVIPALAHQKHKGDHVSGLLEVGRDFALPQSFTLTPYISGSAVYLHEGSYNETGASYQNLSVRARHNTTIQGKGGVQLQYLWKWDECTPVYSFVRLGATGRRTLKKHQKVVASLVGQGGKFTTLIKNKNIWLSNPSVGVTAQLSKGISATLAYEGEIGKLQRNHQAMVRINWGF
jgi:outer membrane autotransporter protein